MVYVNNLTESSKAHLYNIHPSTEIAFLQQSSNMLPGYPDKTLVRTDVGDSVLVCAQETEGVLCNVLPQWGDRSMQLGEVPVEGVNLKSEGRGCTDVLATAGVEAEPVDGEGTVRLKALGYPGKMLGYPGNMLGYPG
eukprot:379506-Prorocentrum_minimum.AAC.1